jgi:hypothetical protein
MSRRRPTTLRHDQRSVWSEQSGTVIAGYGIEGVEAMTGATMDQETHPKRAKLEASLVGVWLVMGIALVVTAVVAMGWRRAVLIWLVSAVALAVLLIVDRIVAHKQGH